MCEFFSAIATRDGRLLFTEQDHHETIIQRAALKDDSRFLRWWVRVELRHGETRLRVDETSVPAWFEAGPWQDRMDTLLHRVAPARAAYHKRLAAVTLAYQTARARAWTVYERAIAAGVRRTSGWTAYETACRQAWVTHAKACARAGAAYTGAICPIDGYLAPLDRHLPPAWTTHMEACARAGAAYEGAIRPIDGSLAGGGTDALTL